MTLRPDNATEALYWLAVQPPEHLRTDWKYQSRCSVLGRRYVHVEPQRVLDAATCEQVYTQVAELSAEIRHGLPPA